jgi:hypothetical protein
MVTTKSPHGVTTHKTNIEVSEKFTFLRSINALLAKNTFFLPMAALLLTACNE